MLLQSEDPQFSMHLKKNPAGKLTSKAMRQGMLSGWFPHDNVQQYALLFRDLTTENSFSEEGKNYLDLTQYASTYFVFHSLSTFFNHALKLDPAQQVFKHKVVIPTVQLRTEKTVQHLNDYIGLDITIENISESDIERMSIYEISIEGDMPFNEFLMKVYLLFYLLHADLYQSDIVWMEGMIAKVVGVMQELKSEYFLRYWFKRNVLIKPSFYAQVEEALNSGSSDGSIVNQVGNTQQQRKDFVGRFMDFTVPIVDVGCGEGDYVLPYAKKLKGSDLPIVGVDVDHAITNKLNDKIIDRKLLNALAINSLDHVHINKPHDILCVEVIEHMPLADAKALVVKLLKRNFRQLIISTPNRDFNKFYRTMTGFRHDDHHFEFNRDEFKTFITECINEAKDGTHQFRYDPYGVGDTVNAIPMSQAVVMTKVPL